MSGQQKKAQCFRMTSTEENCMQINSKRPCGWVDASLLLRLDGPLYPSVSATAHGATIAFSLQSIYTSPPSDGRFGSAIDWPIGIDTSHVSCVGFRKQDSGAAGPGPRCAISGLLANSIASTATRPSMQHLAPALASIRHLHSRWTRQER